MSISQKKINILKFTIDFLGDLPYNKNMITIYLARCDKSRSHDFLFKIFETDYGIKADESGLVRSPYGKLALLECEHFFNISHSGDMVVVAIGKRRLGVDIEKIHPANHEKLAKKYFGSVPETDEQFYTLWTKAESFVKYNAASIVAELKKIVIDGDNIIYDGEMQSVTTKTIKYEDYIISVASKDTEVKVIDCGKFEY